MDDLFLGVSILRQSHRLYNLVGLAMSILLVEQVGVQLLLPPRQL